MRFRGHLGLALLTALGACAPSGAIDGNPSAGFIAYSFAPGPAVSRDALEEVLLRSVALSL